MVDNRHLVLINRLHERTSSGDLKWERTVDDGTYQIAFKGYSIRIRERPGEGAESDIVVAIFNDEGVEIEEFSDLDVNAFESSGLKKRANYLMMVELFNRARRQSLGVDKAVDDILKQLGGE